MTLSPIRTARGGIAVCLFVLAGCVPAAEHANPAPLAPADVHVIAAAGAAPAGLVLPARVEAREEVTLTARLGARLTALPVREGESFRRGRTLATFDAPETHAALDGARAALEAATVARDLARRQEARMDTLYSGHVAALRELEGAQAERRAAEAQWAQARARVDEMRSGATLEAPFDGVVVRRHVDPGTTVGPGQPLLDLRSSEVGEIVASVPEAELRRLSAGTFEYQIGDGAWVPATLARVDGMTDWSTRTRSARFRPASGARLEAGSFARLRLAGGAATTPGESGAHVPLTALVRRGGLTGVFVAENGVAHLRWLRVGRESGGAIEVLAGLGRGDTVILEPAGLVDGRPVRIVS